MNEADHQRCVDVAANRNDIQIQFDPLKTDPALNVTPKIAELGAVKTGATAESKIIIQGSKPFRITKIQGGDEQLVVTDSTKEAKQVHVLTLALKAGKAGGMKE